MTIDDLHNRFGDNADLLRVYETMERDDQALFLFYKDAYERIEETQDISELKTWYLRRLDSISKRIHETRNTIESLKIKEAQ